MALLYSPTRLLCAVSVLPLLCYLHGICCYKAPATTMRYAMHSTDIAHAATKPRYCGRVFWYKPTAELTEARAQAEKLREGGKDKDQVEPSYWHSVWYALSGTGIAYGKRCPVPTRLLCGVYAGGMRSPVLTWRMLLPGGGSCVDRGGQSR
eukprot:3080296-Rhodomonas_salina.2